MLPLFIILTIILIVSVLAFIFMPSLIRWYRKRRLVPFIGKAVYKTANEDDYYLINELVLEANDDSQIKIDHLLLGNKYLFVFKDYYFNGALSFKENDPSWIYYFGKSKHPSQTYIDNPIIENDERINKLSQITGLEKSLLISVVVINDDCLFDSYSSKDGTCFVIRRKDIKHLVEEVENRDVAPLDEDQLRYAVHDLARLNLKP